MRPLPSGGATSSFNAALENEAATQRLAVDIAQAVEPGTLITLSGHLGAGKTTFARALIRVLAGNPNIAVPSPTFTIVQTYDLPRFTVVHADFYRLASADELTELGLDDMPEDAVMLVEWPDRAGSNWPPDRIDVSFTLSPEHDLTYRNARVTGFGAQAGRIARVGLLRSFLQNAGYAEAERRHMQGDASTRAYELLTLDGRSSVLMNAPRRPDGPPVRGNKSYSAIAHLAEDVKPFVAMARGLRARGFSAPDILAADLENGFLILEDLGTEPVVAGNPPVPIEERYETAVDVLLALHWLRLPDYLEVIPGIEHTIPRYGLETFLIEAELLLDWYIPYAGGHISAAARAQFINLWRETMLPVLTGDQTWVLRDYHSPNLLWLPQREGIQRAGLLDFQDALIGPPAYDLASLLQDARIDVPEALELKLLTHYCKMRKYRDVKFSVTDFAQTYAIVAAQRSTKILGIFARLDRRDGKPQYLRHMPRIWGYLQRSLSHPALAALRLWYRDNVPAHRPHS